MNFYWMAKMIGLLNLRREYSRGFKRNPDSFFYLKVTIMCEIELDRMLDEVQISGALEILKSDK